MVDGYLYSITMADESLHSITMVYGYSYSTDKKEEEEEDE
jgi:hypothetical protein